MRKVDITRQCRVELEFTNDGEALVYLYHYETKIGLFDKHGFHFMTGSIEEQYYIEDGYLAHSHIVWFKVYEKR